ncbi:PREDICTED: POTE ankyrin domain family member A-like, partial [Propithecus coquereli]|uniref:POTE ankyrin domain family member A-like n=1 Tax=Propithecus coquereli TaxID=379532 RepID=UPI00063EE3A7
MGCTCSAPSGETQPPRRKKSHSLNSPQGYVVHLKDLGKFHKAVYRGELEEVRKMFYYNRDVLNTTDKKHRTALHLACASRNAQVVAFLLDKKCDLNPCDGENRTPLMKVCSCQLFQHEMVKSAVQRQAQECIIMLLERGADPNAVDVHGNSALHYAAYNGNLSIAAKLHAHGAAMEIANKEQRTPLLLALRKKKVEVAEFLIKERADINVVDRLQRTPLMLAVRCGSSSTVSLLLQQSVDVFAKNYRGWTAEDYAVFNGSN